MPVQLENENLTVAFDAGGRPWFTSIHHRPTGVSLSGIGPDGCLVVDGRPAAWSEWRVVCARTTPAGVEWALEPEATGVPALRIAFTLEPDRLRVCLSAAPLGPGRTSSVGARGMPLVAWRAPGGFFYREEVRQLSWRRIKFAREDRLEEIRYGVVDPAPVPAVHACAFDGRAVAFVSSNQRVAPFTTRLVPSARWPGRSAGFDIAFADWEVQAGGHPRSPLQMEVVISADLNGDGRADECDYLLWLNRRTPLPADIYRRSFWYKIANADLGRGLVTTFEDALEIIRAVHHFTDGMPQVAFLTGWKFREFEDAGLNLDLMGFGGMEALPETAGTLGELRWLHREAEALNCAVSYHLNLDDSYREHNQWDESILCRETDGTLVEWLRMFGRTAYHISHAKDVRSGAVFRRLEKLLETVPCSGAVHLDAFRNTNLSWDGGAETGLVEELERGCDPIIDFLQRRGLAVSIEGVRQMPIEQVGWVSAFWHMSRVTDFLPRLVHFHGKAIGGGIIGVPERVAYGLGSSCNRDLCFRGSAYPGILSMADNLAGILDLLYLGHFLHRFYLERELLEARTRDGVHRLRFADGVVAEVAADGSRLMVDWNGVAVARDDDRFMPLNDGIFAYSRHGSRRRWLLPPAWQGVPLRAMALGREGRLPFDAIASDGRTVDLALPPRLPVRILPASPS